MRCILAEQRRLGATHKLRPDGQADVWADPSEANKGEIIALAIESRSRSPRCVGALLRYEARLGREVFR